MMRTLHLHGPLLEKFGGPYTFEVNTFRELMAAMQMINPTFRRELCKFDDLALMLADPVTKEHTFLETHELMMAFGNWPELHLGVGVRGNAEGAAYVAAYFFQAGTTAYYIAYAVAYVAITVAISYAVSTVMMGLQDTPSTEDGKRAQNKSDLFNGPQNTESQGGRVQLVFGRFRVGSYTLSQSIEARRQAIGIADSVSVTEGSNGTLNIFANDSGLISPFVSSFSVNGGGSIAAGGTHSGTGWSISVSAAGIATLITTSGSGGIEATVQCVCSSDGVPFTSSLGIGITTNYAYYDYGGGGNGGGDGDGGTGGGDSGGGEGDGGGDGW